jgi:hypothetical protein
MGAGGRQSWQRLNPFNRLGAFFCHSRHTSIDCWSWSRFPT